MSLEEGGGYYEDFCVECNLAHCNDCTHKGCEDCEMGFYITHLRGECAPCPYFGCYNCNEYSCLECKEGYNLVENHCEEIPGYFVTISDEEEEECFVGEDGEDGEYFIACEGEDGEIIVIDFEDGEVNEF